MAALHGKGEKYERREQLLAGLRRSDAVTRAWERVGQHVLDCGALDNVQQH